MKRGLQVAVFSLSCAGVPALWLPWAGHAQLGSTGPGISTARAQEAWSAGEPWSFVLPEQRAIQVRAPEQLSRSSIPASERPSTVEDLQFDATPIPMSLSEVLNLSLQNMDVVRVLAGINASSTGRTIYDPAIANTAIDTARGVFDPFLSANQNWTEANSPRAFPDPVDPGQTNIEGFRTDRYGLNLGLSKRMVTGGVIDFGVIGDNTRFPGVIAPLNPEIGSSAALQLTQPLLQGAGIAVNQAPIVIARIDTERSFFQFKDAVQSHVQSVIQGYWQLVLARTDLWAREQQVQQLEFLLRRAEDRVEVGDARLGEFSQARVAYENFRANLLAAQGNILQRETALRNVLGLTPYDQSRIVPTSPLVDQRLEWNWEQLLVLAEQQRPEIIELKLILEADQQRLLLRNNEALPRLDAVALYRWNGLEGTVPAGPTIRADDFDDWTLGVNFSVPIGLRSSRALLRQQELLIQRDRVNLQQGLHQASHDLAITVRNIELSYAQYRRFQEVRKAAQENLDQQIEIGNELEPFIVLLQAIVDWGNAISNEAQALVQYNSELAALERETGTILETHGIAFFEERFGSIGPLGRLALPVCYPETVNPTDNVDRYPAGDQPSESQFELVDPLRGEEFLSDEPGAEPLPPPPEEAQPSAGSWLRSVPIRAAERLKNWLR
jgi:outer membrane protein TolC